jgi:hypothetical protein
LNPLPLKEIKNRIQDATQHPDKIYRWNKGPVLK